MLDQFIVSGNMLSESTNIQALPVHIYKADWLNYNDPKHGPKPSRTYGGPNILEDIVITTLFLWM